MFKEFLFYSSDYSCLRIWEISLALKTDRIFSWESNHFYVSIIYQVSDLSILTSVIRSSRSRDIYKALISPSLNEVD